MNKITLSNRSFKKHAATTGFYGHNTFLNCQNIQQSISLNEATKLIVYNRFERDDSFLFYKVF